MKSVKIALLWPVGLRNFDSATAIQRYKYLSEHFNLQVIYPKYSSVRSDLLNSPNINRVGPRRKSVVGYLLAAYRALRDFKPDIVMTQCNYPAVFGKLFANAVKAKWVVDIWDHPLLAAENYRDKNSTFMSLVHTFIGYLVLLSLKKADGVISSIHPSALEGYVQADRIWDVPNGTLYDKLERIRQAEVETDELHMSYIGDVTLSRGLKLMLETTSIISEFHPQIRLTLIGPTNASSKKWLDSNVANLKLEKNVCYHGRLPWRTALSLVAKSTFCLLPFRNSIGLNYIYPIKVLEALSLGKVVISSNLKGIRRIISDGYNGVLVDSLDAKDWAHRILSLIDAPLERERLMKAAILTAKRYAWEKVNEKLAEGLLNLIER